MQSSATVKGDAGDARRGAPGRQRDVARDLPVFPIGGDDAGRRECRPDREWVEAAESVQHVATTAITQQHQPFGDVEVWPVWTAARGGRTTERMDAAIAIEGVALRGGNGRGRQAGK